MGRKGWDLVRASGRFRKELSVNVSRLINEIYLFKRLLIILSLLQYILLCSRPPTSETKEYFSSVVHAPHAEIVGETDLDFLRRSSTQHIRQSISLFISVLSQTSVDLLSSLPSDLNSKSPASKLANLLSLHSSLLAYSRTVVFASSKSSLKALHEALQLSELSSLFSLRGESLPFSTLIVERRASDFRPRDSPLSLFLTRFRCEFPCRPKPLRISREWDVAGSNHRRL